jgi:hypothetical protein
MIHTYSLPMLEDFDTVCFLLEASYPFQSPMGQAIGASTNSPMFLKVIHDLVSSAFLEGRHVSDGCLSFLPIVPLTSLIAEIISVRTLRAGGPQSKWSSNAYLRGKNPRNKTRQMAAIQPIIGIMVICK